MRGRDDDAFVTPETGLSLVLHKEASTVTNSDYCVRHDPILGANVISAISCDTAIWGSSMARRCCWAD
jgi:hypothetical protein